MGQGNGISRDRAGGNIIGRYIYKVPEGKLIKVWVEVLRESEMSDRLDMSGITGASGHTLVDIRLTGDFFIHPEEWIADLEDELRGAALDVVPDIIRRKVEEDNVLLVGINQDDIIHAIEQAMTK